MNSSFHSSKDSTTTVILLGASTRAAATSVLRAGWTPWCADLFADADLKRIAMVRRIPDDQYPEGLLDALKDAPPGPVMYTGALENRPELIAKIDRPLWGNPPELVRAVRTPMWWTACLQRTHGVRCPAVADQPMATGRWLLKPIKSGGGLGIRPYMGQPFNPRTHFLQEWIEGQPFSAIFLGPGKDDHAFCLGISQQLIGTPWLNARGFQYAGSIDHASAEPGPTALAWHDLGIGLAQFKLRGLFGVDAIVRGGEVWPVEINPRYTASMELMERRYRKPLLALHGGVFENTPAPFFNMPPGPIWGKAILFARQTFTFPERGPWLESLEAGVDLDETEYADIPHVGEIIEQGQPVLTIFASASSTEDCRAKLKEKAQALDRRLWG